MTTRPASTLTPADIGSHVHVPSRGSLMHGVLTRLIPTVPERVAVPEYVGIVLQRGDEPTHLGLDPGEDVVVTPQEVEF